MKRASFQRCRLISRALELSSPIAIPGGGGPLKGLAYLGGDNIAPGCELRDPTNPEALDAAVRCWFARSEPLIRAEGESPALVRWGVDEVSGGTDGFVFVRVSQRTRGGAVIVPGDLTLVFAADGRLVQATSRLALPKQLPDPAVESLADGIAPDAARFNAELATGAALAHVRRFYDLAAHAMIDELADDGAHRLLHVDVATGLVVREVSTVENSSQVTKYMDVYFYPSSFTGMQFQNDIGGVYVREQPFSSSCVAYMDRGFEALGGDLVPRVGYEGAFSKVDPFDDASGYWEPVTCGNNQCFACNAVPGYDHEFDVANAYFWNSDLHGFVNSTRAAYDAWYDWTEHKNVGISVEDSVAGHCDPPAPACFKREASLNCGILCDWRIYLERSSEGSRNLTTMAHEYGHAVHHAYGHHTNDFPGGIVSEGFADHNVLRYAMYRWREDANRPHDSFPLTQGYAFGDEDDGITRPVGVDVEDEYRLRPMSSNGEWRPYRWRKTSPHCDPGQGDICDPDSTLTVWGSGTICNAESTAKKYACGSMLSQIYWELAWNTCRIGHGAHDTSVAGSRIVYCDAGQSIIRTGTFVSEPEKAANVAFSYAIKTAPYNLEAFVDALNSRYNEFRAAGSISLDDYLRVKAVLNQHCLGWHDYCYDGQHRVTPGGALPRMLTKKADMMGQTFPQVDTLWGAYPDHWPEAFRVASAGTRSASTALGSFGLSDGSQYVQFNEPADNVSFQFGIANSGCYSFHAVVLSQAPSGDSMYLKVGSNGTSRVWDVEDNLSGWWWWSHFRTSTGALATIFLNKGSATYWPIKLSHREPMSIEALLIRKEFSTTNSANCTYFAP